MAIRADFEVELVLGRAGLPRRSAGTTRLDVEILGVNPFLHGVLLDAFGKTSVYHKELTPVLATA
jgi:hypothetical protein